MPKLKIALTAVAILGMSTAAALAMPVSNLGKTDAGVKADNVRWVCNPWGRCWWRPNYYGAYAYYGRPRPYYWGHRHRHWRDW